MTMTKNNQPSAQHDVRSNTKWSRVRMTLAGSGVAGAMLLTGLFGAPALAHAQTHQAHAASVIHVQTAPMADTQANDYVSIARQAAAAAGISPDLFVRQI